MAGIPRYKSHLRSGKIDWKEYRAWVATQKLSVVRKETENSFNYWIVVRDGKCLRCGTTEKLTCSHFWSSRRTSTKFDEDNCIAACVGCHLFVMEKEKQGEYRDIMIKILGQKKYDALQKKANGSLRLYLDDYLTIIDYCYAKTVKKRGKISDA